jgi:hypothetical protein
MQKVDQRVWNMVVEDYLSMTAESIGDGKAGTIRLVPAWSFNLPWIIRL